MPDGQDHESRSSGPAPAPASDPGATPPSQGAAKPFPPRATGFGRNGRAPLPLFSIGETRAGRIQGVVNTGIAQFKGVPYGAPTGGKNRFRPPQPPEPWRGVRDCFGYGQAPPQAPSDLRWDYAAMLQWDSHIGPGGMGEDCLNLNLWTPGLDGARRPVLVAFHGGGWVTGSANGPMYDGARLARLGDVVVVTINHRIGAFGFAHLADLGPPDEWALSGVCGLLDLVAALEWVRDNIAGFGGDPGRVTIFGHSGGGWKVSALMAMPAAKGLFHRAGVQSGATLRLQSRAEGTAQAQRLVDRLAIGSGPDITRLADVSWEQLLEAQTEVCADVRPVVDGRAVPRHPFDPDAPTVSAEVPLLIGTTLHDWSNMFEDFSVKDAGVIANFRDSWGARAEEIFKAYRDETPDETPFRLQGRAYTDASRGNAMLQAERKAALRAAPAYLYEWDWAPPTFEGRYGAVHGVDLDASFGLFQSPMSGSGAADGRLMSDRMAATWVAFARTGDPSNPLIPDWPPYDIERRATMVFDREMRVVDDHRGDFVRLIGETGPATSFVRR